MARFAYIDLGFVGKDWYQVCLTVPVVIDLLTG
jgi:hypothetical protein